MKHFFRHQSKPSPGQLCPSATSQSLRPANFAPPPPQATTSKHPLDALYFPVATEKHLVAENTSALELCAPLAVSPQWTMSHPLLQIHGFIHPVPQISHTKTIPSNPLFHAILQIGPELFKYQPQIDLFSKKSI
jgi:hypothetical protein